MHFSAFSCVGKGVLAAKTAPPQVPPPSLPSSLLITLQGYFSLAGAPSIIFDHVLILSGNKGLFFRFVSPLILPYTIPRLTRPLSSPLFSVERPAISFCFSSPRLVSSVDLCLRAICTLSYLKELLFFIVSSQSISPPQSRSGTASSISRFVRRTVRASSS